METLYNKDITKLTLLYTIEDIKNMLNIDADNKEICNELKNIQYVELDSNSNIKITNIENYFKKYKNYII